MDELTKIAFPLEIFLQRIVVPISYLFQSFSLHLVGGYIVFKLAFVWVDWKSSPLSIVAIMLDRITVQWVNSKIILCLLRLCFYLRPRMILDGLGWYFISLFLLDIGAKRDAAIVINEMGRLWLRTHDDLIDLRKYIFFSHAAYILVFVYYYFISGVVNWSWRMVAPLVYVIRILLILFLSLYHLQVLLDLPLELRGHIRLLKSFRSYSVLYAFYLEVYFLFLIQRLQFFLEVSLLLVLAIIVMKHAIFR